MLAKCIGDQETRQPAEPSALLRVAELREVKAFRCSTFLVHDLKNTASTLSMMLRVCKDISNNRTSARRIAWSGQSVERINDLISVGFPAQQPASTTHYCRSENY
jgi:hypothetical protein